MNGILLINKEKGYTSRDIVNIVGKELKTKKIGHTGTLDPIATGVLTLCIGEGLKLVELLTNHDKEYIAKVKLGIETDTLDITGKVIKKKNKIKFSKEEIELALEKMKGKQQQEVPIYSSIKVKGKKLYEYARNNEKVKLPMREIEIYDIKLLNTNNKDEFTFWTHVSKGTYIRSLIRDIGYKLNTYATMEELTRTKLGKFKIENCYSLEQIKNKDFKLLSILDTLDFPKIKVKKELEDKILNGQVLPAFFKEEKATIVNEKGSLLAIYMQIDNERVKPYRMFKNE